MKRLSSALWGCCVLPGNSRLSMKSARPLMVRVAGCTCAVVLTSWTSPGGTQVQPRGQYDLEDATAAPSTGSVGIGLRATEASRLSETTDLPRTPERTLSARFSGNVTVAAAASQPAAEAIAPAASGLPPSESSRVDADLNASLSNLLVAPLLDRTVVTTTSMQSQFLYSGSSPVQTGVTAGAVDPTRAAILMGNVFDRDSGGPLAGVTVTAVGHPEFGRTTTNADGSYRMVVNGGGIVTLDFELDGLLSGRRQMHVAHLEHFRVNDLALVRAPVTGSGASFALAAARDVAAPEGTLRMYRGPVVTDENGTRQVSMYFPRTSSAGVVRANWAAMAPVSAVTVHATEYTSGPNGLAAMPADLPPATAYTYAVEFTADEGTHAQFDPPIPVYVDNFLSFPTGTQIPSGSYDRDAAQWVASENGRVIKILSITADGAELDVDGSGRTADAATLATLGITTEERAQLATTYSAGKTLWRVPIAHFSLWDFNLGLIPPKGAKPGDPGDDIHQPPAEPCTVESNSTIECETQTLRENVPIVGTPFSLGYRSDRVVGRTDRYTLQIPVTGATLPGPLQGVDVEITVAGRQFSQQFIPVPNQIMTFTWDGYDAFGHLLQGTQPVRVSVGNLYQAEYANTPRFGAPGDGTSTGVVTRTSAPLTGTRTYKLGAWDARGVGLGGWDLDVHHVYDPVGRTLVLGGGSLLTATQLSNVISTVAGNGVGAASPDGTPAIAAKLSSPQDQAIGPDGLLYVADLSCIRRVLADGTLDTYAGDCQTAGDSGDGGPARAAKLQPSYLTFGSDSALYFTDNTHHKVRKIASSDSHVISTVAGTGAAGFSGDGGWATSATLRSPRGIAVSRDGTVYIADNGNGRLRRIGPDGMIQTIAGNNPYAWQSTGTDGPATAAALVNPSGVAVGADGNVYVTETSLIRRIGVDGVIRAFAGGGASSTGDGVPATEVTLGMPWDIAVGVDGSVYFTDKGTFVVRRVDAAGTITTVAGVRTKYGFSGDGGPATSAELYLQSSPGIVVGPDDVLYVCDDYNRRIRQIKPALPGVGVSDLAVPSESGREIYIFNSAGKHLRTVDSLVPTALPLHRFDYDPLSGVLAQVTDVDGNVSSVLRDAAGNVTGIRAPRGQVTTIELGPDGYVASITNPAAESTKFTYHTGGLLNTKTDPRGFVSKHEYDPQGRLILDADPPEVGGSQTLAYAPKANGWSVDRTTALGRATHYDITQLATRDRRRDNTLPDLTHASRVDGQNGVVTTTSADGTVAVTTKTPDPRFGMLAPIVSTAITTPGGLTRTEAVSRAATLSNPVDLLSLTSYAETRVINGHTYRTAYDPTTRIFTTTTPTSRQFFLSLDSQGRIGSTQTDGVLGTQFVYDARGRLEMVTTGTRSTTMGYDPASGFLATSTDALNHTTHYATDLAGRPSLVTYPDATALQLGYDKNGNLASVTPPGASAHKLEYNGVDLLSLYTPPAAPSTGSLLTQYLRDADHALAVVSLPDGSTVQWTPDSAGRPRTVTLPTGTMTRDYHPATGKLVSVAGPYGETVAFDYDGPLEKSMSWSGPVAGTVTRTHDAEFRVAAEQVNSGSAVSFGYDADGLLISAGPLTLTRDPRTGFVNATTLGSVTEVWTYDEYGALASYTAKFGSTTVYQMAVTTRDPLGRISQKREALDGHATTYDYAYDLRGRLTDVRKDGTLAAHYGYDDNGNRTLGPSGQVGVVDAQDRLSTYGTKRYTYGANGELRTKVDAAESSTYTYDVLGSLISVGLPGRSIEYVIDGVGRRVGKRVGGVLTKGFLYRSRLQPIAELDGAGNVVSSFVYGTRPNVPDVMVKAGETYRLVSDHLGSVRLVVNAATGAVAQRIDYDEFGVVTSDSNPGFQPFGFAGGLYDPDTKLVRFGARDYDAETGRWTAKDPIAFEGDQANLYAYVDGDPLNFVDPDGTILILPVFVGAAWGAGLDIGIQLAANDWDFECVNWASVAISAGVGAAGGALGVVGKGAKAFEFSHFMPARWARNGGGAARAVINSGLNGNYVPRAMHIATDPYRFRFVPQALKASTFRLPPGLAQAARMPGWFAGGIVGAGVGEAVE